MLTRIALEWFRGFRSLSLETRLITVLAGPNSSGKSSILHAVRMGAAGLSMALDESELSPCVRDGRVFVCQDFIIRDHTRLMPIANWHELFTGSEVRQGIVSIDLTFDEKQAIENLRVDLAYARNAVLKMTVSVRSPGALEVVASIPKSSPRVGQRLRDEIRRNAPQAVLVPAFYGVTLAEEYRTGAVMHRLLQSGEQSRIIRNLVARLDGPAFERLNGFLQQSVGAKLESRTTSQDAEKAESLEVHFLDSNVPLELSSAGAGLVSLVTLYSALERYRIDRERPVIFLLDEPEAHLHPRLQGQIGVALADIAKEFGAQLILGTHSVEMINRLGQRDDSVLVSVDRAASPPAVPLTREAEIVSKLSEWCDLTPFASLSFLSSRKILFHEGPADAKILRRCARVYFRTDDARRREFQRWTFVPLSGVGNVGSAAVFRNILSPQFFPTLDAKQVVSVIVILDRDCKLQPRFESSQPEKHLAMLDVVWSRYSIESLFLDPQCLAGWLAAALPPGAPDEPALAKLVSEGIDKADTDQALCDKAIEELAALYRLTEKPPDVLKESRKDARLQPDVRQHGKKRAALILAHVRAGLDMTLRNKVRGSIDGLLEAADENRLGSPSVVIPEEIRKVLDFMVSVPTSIRSK
jgi:hypothetical protein